MNSAFSDFTRAAYVEAQTLPPTAGAGRPLLALTRGLAPAAPATCAGDATNCNLWCLHGRWG